MLPPLEHLATLPAEEITELLLAEPEGQWYDRKSARIQPRQLAESLVAMANADGGLLVIGLHGGRCEGVDGVEAAQNSWRQSGHDFTRPPVQFTVALLDCVNNAGRPDHLFALSVSPSEHVHATAKDEAFLRVGDENRRLSFEQRIELRYDRGDTTFEITPAPGPRRSSLDGAKLAAYAEHLGHPDPQRLLQARDLVSVDGATSCAAALLFGAEPEPQRSFPAAWVRVLRYRGNERLTGEDQNLLRDERCEGTLPEQIDGAAAVLREIMPRRKALGADGRFGWFDLIPERAWLEALVNAVIHRAYSNFGDHIRISVFDDRLEVFSPGRFPGVNRPDDLSNVPRFARNPRIARVMRELEYGEEMGEGLRRMVATMESMRLRRPLLRETPGGVELTLFNTPSELSPLRELPQFTREIFDRIEHAGRMRTGELVELSGASRPTVLRHLNALRDRGLIRWVGLSATDPQAYWVVNSDQ